MLQRFSYTKVAQIDRENNLRADELSKLATMELGFIPAGIKLEFVNEWVIYRLEFMIVEEAARCRIDEIQDYIEHGMLPADT